MRICFVCLGNICRSPTAEGVMRDLVTAAGLAGEIAIESAGTGSWHVGEAADPRTAATAARRGYDLSAHRAQQFTAADFARFDLVIAMDRSNLRDLERTRAMASAGESPPIRLLRSFEADAADGADVPDPYSDDGRAFERVVDICERACRGLLAHLRESRA